MLVKILSAKACAITLLQNPTLCRLPFMSHWDATVASVTVDYVMSGGQCNSRHNWLWHVRKWQISPRNLKRQFSKGRAGAEPGCEVKTTYKLKDGERVSSFQIWPWAKLEVHIISIYILPSVLSVYPMSGSTTMVTQLGLSAVDGTFIPECSLSAPSCLAQIPKFYSFSILPRIYEADQILTCYSSQGHISL